ncbi:uncharacterized protein BDZ99DRAFT_281700 [Mytilinidion resinicola]|uniref:Nuclear protein DGCR14 n=1 Tax=Mytilinidion resinicola TaxID=574789 RepID=A0A6A6YSQ9_9PEZI|nr:uncharacterized protein BDZ99DRAFT_281700 [Mytilinidion resinicola]KAF2811840.1 hypothetical protein BDZ99DRAFT_281700 [Mytilinidion resinicola]
MASPKPSQALSKRDNTTALMGPPPVPKRRKRPATVLDEDLYTDALSHIIARDFFPGLLETKAQQEYLDALDSQDSAWIATAGRKLTDLMGEDGRKVRGRRGTSMTPSMTPMRHLGRDGSETPRAWGSAETPVSVAGSEFGGSEYSDGERKQEVDLNLSLTAFQAKYTSEDNESFNKLLDRENARKSEKYAWAYNGNKILASRQVMHREREAAKQLEAGEAARLAEKDNEAASSVLKTHRLVTPLDARPAMPTSAPYRPKNALMFPPDSVEETHTTAAMKAESASMAPPKTVLHANTRFPGPLLDPYRPEDPPSPTLSAVQDAIAGRPRPTESEAGYTGAETPRVGGYAFVDAEPDEPPPLDLLRGYGEQTPRGTFEISDIGRREKLHDKMVERLGRGKREGSVASSSSSMISSIKGGPTPRFLSAPSKARGNLTPAALRLFERVGTPRREGPGSAFGGAMGEKRESRSEWEPTPKRGDGGGAFGGGVGKSSWTPTPRVKRMIG